MCQYRRRVKLVLNLLQAIYLLMIQLYLSCMIDHALSIISDLLRGMFRYV